MTVERQITIRSNTATVADVPLPDLGFSLPLGGTALTYTDDEMVEAILASNRVQALVNDNAYPASGDIATHSVLLFDSNGVYIAPGAEDVLGLRPVEVLVQPFLFSDASPVDFGVLAAGEIILDTKVEVTTVFDDGASTLAVGLQSSPGGILGTGDIDPTAAAIYGSRENVSVPGADAIRLQITPGTSSQGAGRVTVMVRR